MTDEMDILARTIYGEARGEYTHPEGGLGALIAVRMPIPLSLARHGVARIKTRPLPPCWKGMGYKGAG